jgi:hypothetical protein
LVKKTPYRISISQSPSVIVHKTHLGLAQANQTLATTSLCDASALSASANPALPDVLFVGPLTEGALILLSILDGVRRTGLDMNPLLPSLKDLGYEVSESIRSMLRTVPIVRKRDPLKLHLSQALKGDGPVNESRP